MWDGLLKMANKKSGCRKNVLMCKCENVLINTNSIYCFDYLQIIRLAHIFISSYFQIFTLVFVEALIFWSFFIPSASSGQRRKKDCKSIKFSGYELRFHPLLFFSRAGQKKSSSRKAPKGPFYASYTPLPQSIF